MYRVTSGIVVGKCMARGQRHCTVDSIIAPCSCHYGIHIPAPVHISSRHFGIHIIAPCSHQFTSLLCLHPCPLFTSLPLVHVSVVSTSLPPVHITAPGSCHCGIYSPAPCSCHWYLHPCPLFMSPWYLHPCPLFMSLWYLHSGEDPQALHPISQEFPQDRNGDAACVITVYSVMIADCQWGHGPGQQCV